LVAGDDIWSANITFAAGTTPGPIEYKYAAHYFGADTVNGSISPLDNELGAGTNHHFTLKYGQTERILDNFGQSARSLKVVKPNGNEYIAGGSQYRVFWTSGTGSQIKLLFSSDNGNIWDTLATALNAFNTTYLWNVPEINSNQCLVKVIDAANYAILDVSDAPFAINSSLQGSVTFRVNMKRQLRAGLFTVQDSVVVRGDFQVAAGDPNGNWQGNHFRLEDSDGDSIYTRNVAMPLNAAGTSYMFKFVKNDSGWEPNPNRVFVFEGIPSQVLPAYWFANDSSAVTQVVTNTIKFTADMSDIYGTGVGYFDPAQDSLLVMGLDWDGLGTLVSGNRRTTELISPARRFVTTLVIKGFLGDSTKWKFKAYADSRFSNTGWELGEDRWFKYVTDGSVIDLPEIKPRIFPLTFPLTAPVTLQFSVHLKNAVNVLNGLPIPVSQVNFVGMKGGSPAIGNWGGNWIASDTVDGTMIRLNNSGVNGDLVAGDEIWSTNVTFPTGTQTGQIEFKFGANYPGADTVNGGAAYLDNELAFGNNHVFALREGQSERILHNFGHAARNLQLVKPNGGEVLTANTNARIFWTSSNSTYLKILFSSNSGSTWDTIMPSILASLTNLSVELPNINSTQCKIKVIDKFNPQIFDESDGVFTIQGGGVQITWQNAITIKDNGNVQGVLTFGMAPGATNGIDPALGELVLPPLPPAGNFDIRFDLPVTPVESSLKDFRKDTLQAAAWTIKLQPGPGGYPFTLTWNPSQLPAGSFTMKDLVTGNIINVDMKTTGQVIVTNSAIASLAIYYAKNIVTTGKGYWIRYPQAAQLNTCGSFAGLSLPLNAGWNLIGIHHLDLPTSILTTNPPGIINSPFYAYNNAYVIATTLLSGKGYWVRASQAGTMDVPVPVGAKAAEVPASTVQKDWSEIRVSDNSGSSSLLYLGNADINSFELPPVPPAGIFDARFANHSFIGSPDGKSDVLISGADYPVTVQSSVKILKITDLLTGGKLLNATVKPGKPVVIGNDAITSIQIESVEMPVSFSLEQNYPNPFNPATAILFALPEKSSSSLRIYNQLGELVTTLINGELEAGYHSVTWNAGGFPSGVYIYELRAGKYSAVKKLVLMK
ncbi:MAG: T9SS type A sorting domain-containing protein, partial [Ignavibacteriales bacterium]|nr:T9SS type A sorting domain-containing protein [Ignavibacteriales bacterium]